MTTQTLVAKPVDEGAASAWIYGVGAVASGVFSTVPSVLLLYYCTAILTMPGLWAAIIVLAPKALAPIWDPMVGRAFDRAGVAPRGRAFLLGGGVVILAIGFVLVFSPPPLTQEALFAWVGLSYLVLAAGYSLFAVSHIAMPAALVENQARRARWVSVRMLLVLVGILLGAGLAPAIIDAFGGGRRGYSLMAYVLGGVCLILAIGPFCILLQRRVGRPAAGVEASIWSGLADRHFRGLLAGYLALVVATGATSAATPYWVVRLLDRREADVGTVLGALLAASVLAVPLWAWLGRVMGKTSALRICALAYALGLAAVGVLVARSEAWSLAILAFAFLGLAFGGLQVLPFGLLADFAHRQARSGGAGEGATSGVWSATEKLGLGLGPALTGLVLQLNGQRVDVTFMIGVSCLAAFLTLFPAFLLRTSPTERAS
jgi:GPH family glycoside/pentoside/hexuronide:cation symporter